MLIRSSLGVMLRKAIAASAITGVLFLVGCSNHNSETSSHTELIISAAASLTDSLKEIQALYEKEHSDIKLIYNFSSSGTLQQQIEQGAPTDLFLSAGKKQMTALVDKGIIAESQQTGLLGNELVVVVSMDRQETTIHSVADLGMPEFEKLAMGQPDNVPAGSYSKESLEHYELWDQLVPKLVYTKDVRQVLTYVETGNVDAGFVYKTDALTSNKVKIAAIIDSSSHSRIEYPLGIVKETKHLQAAQEFYDFLQSEQAQDVFVRFGFSLP